MVLTKRQARSGSGRSRRSGGRRNCFRDPERLRRSRNPKWQADPAALAASVGLAAPVDRAVPAAAAAACRRRSAAVEALPRTFIVKIEALGTLEPRERVVLTANAADRVTGVYFEDGQRVAKGKTLMTLVNEEEQLAARSCAG